MKSRKVDSGKRQLCRSPCGERGLKWFFCKSGAVGGLSLPVRGAWIEIGYSAIIMVRWICRSPCGERGLKYKTSDKTISLTEVAPRAGSVD